MFSLRRSWAVLRNVHFLLELLCYSYTGNHLTNREQAKNRYPHLPCCHHRNNRKKGENNPAIGRCLKRGIVPFPQLSHLLYITTQSNPQKILRGTTKGDLCFSFILTKILYLLPILSRLQGFYFDRNGERLIVGLSPRHQWKESIAYLSSLWHADHPMLSSWLVYVDAWSEKTSHVTWPEIPLSGTVFFLINLKRNTD